MFFDKCIMNFESLTKVSSASLENLQSNLIQLSDKLKECYKLLSSDMSALHEDWQDEKFDEFEEEFRSRKEQIREISEKYREWANSYLPPRIDIIKEAEGRGMGI